MIPLTKAANGFVRLLFEPPCVACRKILDAPLRRAICDSCWNSIEPVRRPFCAICADELHGESALHDACARCRSTRPAYTIARSAGRYDAALREIVHAFKFEGRRLLAEPMGTLLLERGGDVLADTDAVVPVPLHVLRTIRRGFNQADDLARQLKRPVWSALRRRRHGPPQATLSAADRVRNLEQHFDVSLSTVAFRRRQLLEGARLVLIDDVMTTGATLDACARVLLDAGAAEVRALTVARAVAERPSRLPAPPRASATPH